VCSSDLAIIAFLRSTGFEDAIRKAVSLGGDADTVACIAGGIAEACYGEVPADIKETVAGMLDARLLAVVNGFSERFIRR
jgi:ADP-ribosylglycohydrolase